MAKALVLETILTENPEWLKRVMSMFMEDVKESSTMGEFMRAHGC